MNDPWRDWRASLERLGEGPFGEVSRQWAEWIKVRVDTVLGEDESRSSVLGHGATLLKSVLEGRNAEQADETAALYREVLDRLKAVETRLDILANSEEETPSESG